MPADQQGRSALICCRHDSRTKPQTHSVTGLIPLVRVLLLPEQLLNSGLEGAPEALQDAGALLLLLGLTGLLLAVGVMDVVPLLLFPLVAVVLNNH